MKKYRLTTVLMMAFISILIPAHSQTQAHNFKISSERIVKENDQVSISFDFNFAGIKV